MDNFIGQLLDELFGFLWQIGVMERLGIVVIMRITVLAAEDPCDVRTWSGTPYHLVEEFRRRSLLSRAVMVNPKPVMLNVLKLISLDLKQTIRKRRPVSKLKSTGLYHRVIERRLKSLARGMQNDEVAIEIGDLGVLSGTPFFIYIDLDYDTLLDYYWRFGSPPPGFEMLTLSDLERLRERQYSIFRRAAGVFTMSRFLKDSVLASGIFRPNQVHAVGAGTNMLGKQPPPHSMEAYRSKTILFVGKDFERKGGPLLLEAFRRLYAHDKSVRLIIAGPKKVGQGEGVSWLGPVGKEHLSSLYSRASIFCMPSIFEAFGIVFIEAMSYGLPVIGTNRMAMREFIRPGINGFLLEKDDPDLLAEILYKALSDPERLREMGAAAVEMASEYTWPKVVGRMLEGITKSLS